MVLPGTDQKKPRLRITQPGPCLGTSKTVSRVLYLTVIYLDVPLPARSSHPGSGRASLGTRSPCSHTGVAPDRVYSDGLFPAIECALTALFHPYLVITSSISFRVPRLTPVTPKRTQQSGSFRKRRRSGMSAPCRVRRGKGYEACDDEVGITYFPGRLPCKYFQRKRA